MMGPWKRYVHNGSAQSVVHGLYYNGSVSACSLDGFPLYTMALDITIGFTHISGPTESLIGIHIIYFIDNDHLIFVHRSNTYVLAEYCMHHGLEAATIWTGGNQNDHYISTSSCDIS